MLKWISQTSCCALLMQLIAVPAVADMPHFRCSPIDPNLDAYFLELAPEKDSRGERFQLQLQVRTERGLEVEECVENIEMHDGPDWLGFTGSNAQMAVSLQLENFPIGFGEYFGRLNVQLVDRFQIDTEVLCIKNPE